MSMINYYREHYVKEIKAAVGSVVIDRSKEKEDELTVEINAFIMELLKIKCFVLEMNGQIGTKNE